MDGEYVWSTWLEIPRFFVWTSKYENNYWKCASWHDNHKTIYQLSTGFKVVLNFRNPQLSLLGNWDAYRGCVLSRTLTPRQHLAEMHSRGDYLLIYPFTCVAYLSVIKLWIRVTNSAEINKQGDPYQSQAGQTDLSHVQIKTDLCFMWPCEWVGY